MGAEINLGLPIDSKNEFDMDRVDAFLIVDFETARNSARLILLAVIIAKNRMIFADRQHLFSIPNPWDGTVISISQGLKPHEPAAGVSQSREIGTPLDVKIR